MQLLEAHHRLALTQGKTLRIRMELRPRPPASVEQWRHLQAAETRETALRIPFDLPGQPVTGIEHRNKTLTVRPESDRRKRLQHAVV